MVWRSVASIFRKGRKTDREQTPIEKFPWIHGAHDCATSTDPLVQVYQFDQDTFIFRVSKCFSFEGNFVYLLFGSQRAILFDTGPGPDPRSEQEILPIRQVVEAAIESRRRNRAREVPIDLIVAHTHGHGDHAFWTISSLADHRRQ